MNIQTGLRLAGGQPTQSLTCMNCHSRMLEAADEIDRLRAELAECRAKHMDDLLALSATAKAERELRAKLAECRAWILRHGEHDQNCGVFDLDDEGRHCACTCGLAAALAADGEGDDGHR